MSATGIDRLHELTSENFTDRQFARVGSLSPRVISYPLDFTPEANKRMNPKPILSEGLWALPRTRTGCLIFQRIRKRSSA